jgi:hypothetical protein
MNFSQSSFSGQKEQSEAVAATDPRLQPTPDYGNLGPGSDVVARESASTQSAFNQGSAPLPANAKRFRPLFAAAIGVLAAVFAGSIGSARAAWPRLGNLFSVPDHAPASAKKDLRQLDSMKPQTEAEALLELAVANNENAVDQISSRVDRWQGKVQWSPQIATLTTAALNSSDMRVRGSGIEVELAAYGLSKNSSSLDYLLRMSTSSDHARKTWALWALGLMGNRGIETGRVVEALALHLKDADEDSRRWAVEGLALTGSTETIEPLLRTMHDDSSANVRERAACGLAESGMYTHEQRMSAVPRLLSYTDDPSLDAQTQAWASQALSDITHQHFGNNSNAWRNWYSARAE